MRRIGPYELLEVLGRGAMGVVWRARHVELGVEHALKLLAEVEADSEAALRFQREAMAMAALPPHPNVVAVHAAGSEAGTWWLAMDLVAGESLQQRTRTGPVEPRQAAAWIRDAARGLAALHARGLIHRDVKPANVLVDESGTARLADLGMVRGLPGEARLTRTRDLIGTPLFAPPESLDGANRWGPAGDVYGLGLTLFQLLVGRPAVAGGDLITVMTAVVMGQQASLAKAAPATPPELVSLYDRCRDSDPTRRPRAEEVAGELEAWLATSAPPPRGPSTRLLAPAACLGLLLVVGGVAWLRRDPHVSAEDLARPASTARPTPADAARTRARSHLDEARKLSLGSEPRVRAALAAYLELRNGTGAESEQMREAAVLALRRGLVDHAGGLLRMLQLEEADGPVRGLVFASAGRELLAACYGRYQARAPNGRVRRWSLPEWVERPAPIPAGGALRAMSLAPGREWLAIGRDARLELWRLDQAEAAPIGTAIPLAGVVRACPVSTLGEVAAAGDAADLLLRAPDGDVRLIRLDERKVLAACFDPAGEHLALAGAKSVRLLDLRSGTWHLASGPAAAGVAFSGDGRLLFAAGSRLRAFAAPEWERIGPEVALDPAAESCADSSRGLLAVGLKSERGAGRVRLWEMRDDRLVERPELPVVHRESVNVCAFSPDGALLATGSEDGVIALWAVGVAELDPAFLPSLVLEPDPPGAVEAALQAAEELRGR